MILLIYVCYIKMSCLKNDACCKNEAGCDSAPTVSAPRSYVRIQTGNGWGSSSTKVRRFSTIISNVGSSITYADSSTLGATFTINQTGLYGVSYSDKSDAGPVQIAITLNDTQLTTPPVIMDPFTPILTATQTEGNGGCCAGSFFLTAGDVITAKGEAAGSPSADPWVERFSITQLNV